MFMIEEFMDIFRNAYDYCPLFSYSPNLQKIINNNPSVICLESLRAVCVKNKIKVMWVPHSNVDYQHTLNTFNSGMIQESNNFCYFYINYREFNQTVSVIIPFKYKNFIEKRLLKFSNLKSFI